MACGSRGRYENPCTDVFVNLRPGYGTLADEIVEYGETRMPRFGGEKAFVLFPGQTALIEAAQRRGYAVAHEEVDHVFDFLCTVPGHRGKGLAAAALSIHVRRLRPLGARRMTGGGSPFYAHIGYNSQIHWLHWKRSKPYDI